MKIRAAGSNIVQKLMKIINSDIIKKKFRSTKKSKGDQDSAVKCVGGF